MHARVCACVCACVHVCVCTHLCATAANIEAGGKVLVLFWEDRGQASRRRLLCFACGLTTWRCTLVRNAFPSR